MKNAKKLFYTLSVSAAVCSYISETSARDLNDALAVAYKSNPALLAQREKQKSIDEELPQAYGGFLPSLRATYDRTRENISVNNSSDEKNAPNTRKLILDQNVFNGGKSYYSVGLAKNTIYAGRAELHNVEQQTLLDAVTAYMDVVRAREVLKLSQNNEKVLKEQLQATNDRFKLGEATKTDVAQAESRLARAESDRIVADGNVTAAESKYEKIFGEKAGADMEMPKQALSIPDSLEKAKETAIANNPVLKKARFEDAAAGDAVGATRSVILPVVGVRGEVSRTDGGSALFGNIDSDAERVTLNVTVPIFQSGAEYASIRQAKREADSKKYNLRDAKNATIDAVTKAWEDVQTARSNIRATSSSARAAEVALEGVRQEQKAGTRTVLDILDAEQEYFTAKVNLVTAKRNEAVAAYAIKAATGELTAENLGLNTELYNPKDYYNDIKYQMIGY